MPPPLDGHVNGAPTTGYVGREPPPHDGPVSDPPVPRTVVPVPPPVVEVVVDTGGAVAPPLGSVGVPVESDGFHGFFGVNRPPKHISPFSK